MKITTRGLLMAGLMTLSCVGSVQAQDGFLGFGGDKPNVSISIASSDIAIDIPMPVNSANLAQLIEGNNLAAMKNTALRKYQQHMQTELKANLQAFFAEEEISLVEREGLLSLHNNANIVVKKNLIAMESAGDYDVERGTIALTGTFNFQLKDISGRSLRELSVDVAKLKVREGYQTKSSRNGGASEDNTEEAILLALSEMVQRVFRKVDGDLEADELRDLLASANESEPGNTRPDLETINR